MKRSQKKKKKKKSRAALTFLFCELVKQTWLPYPHVPCGEKLRSTKEITEEQQFSIQAWSVAPMHDAADPQWQSATTLKISCGLNERDRRGQMSVCGPADFDNKCFLLSKNIFSLMVHLYYALIKSEVLLHFKIPPINLLWTISYT